MRDSGATRQRIIDAAIEEFSEHGPAGARVDRIARSARANKRALYDYYGNKHDLFEIVVDHVTRQRDEAVPFDVADIPGYAVRLFDHFEDHPAHFRIEQWRRLERPTATPAPTGATSSMIASLDRVSEGFGMSGRFGAAEVLLVVLAVGSMWQTAPPELVAASRADRAHRRALVHGTASILAIAGRRWEPGPDQIELASELLAAVGADVAPPELTET